MGLSKQEMELFLLLPELQSKNVFYKMFLTYTSESKTDFENSNWNYFDNAAKIGFKNRRENYFFYFLSSNQKISLSKCF